MHPHIERVMTSTCQGKRAAAEMLVSRSFGMPWRPQRGYTFGNFRTNRHVARARATVIRYVSGARPYGMHTLAVFGSKGAGKTHLLNAAGHAALTDEQYDSAATLSAEKLVQLVQEGLYFGDWCAWRHRLTQVPWLAVDDVERLGDSQIVTNLFLDVMHERARGKGRTLLTVGQASQVRNVQLKDFLQQVPAIPMHQEYV